mmetsp:Transcript_985/g.1511  ORF Transcript_985/g.1511 Transcript_985/m.1511 type:complete len:122 (+) Transcript_985:216-581(+)
MLQYKNGTSKKYHQKRGTNAIEMRKQKRAKKNTTERSGNGGRVEEFVKFVAVKDALTLPEKVAFAFATGRRRNDAAWKDARIKRRRREFAIGTAAIAKFAVSKGARTIPSKVVFANAMGRR